MTAGFKSVVLGMVIMVGYWRVSCAAALFKRVFKVNNNEV